MAGCKYQLNMKYHSKLSVSNICHIEWVEFLIKKYRQEPAHLRFYLNSGKTLKGELLKIEYLIILSQYFGNFTQEFFVV